tara:strand:- start:10246 stop:10419 length:174 start_codon:yes stop_codon:yes gene_type:complete
MILHYLEEVLQTQAFDVLLANLFWIVLWALMTWRLHILDRKLKHMKEYLIYVLDEVQ